MSMHTVSALYEGRAMHQRLLPRRHRLSYRMLSIFLDLDEIDEVERRCRWFSRNRFNLFSFHDGDYGIAGSGSLRAQIERHLAAAGLPITGAPIRVLTMPRILGGVFNPLSLFFCHRPDGGLAAILYEVNNTFGERHAYLIPAGEAEDGLFSQRCAKAFHVSPFMDMDLAYSFRLAIPAARLSLLIRVGDGEDPTLFATHTAKRVELGDAALISAFLRHPLQVARVLGGIHWEALRLWLKGVRLRSHPSPPAAPVSIVPRPKAHDHG